MTTDRPTHLGIVRLGRMGSSIIRRLVRDGHPCAAFDLDQAAVESVRGTGVTGAATLAEFVGTLPAPRNVWLTLPAGEITERTVGELSGLLAPDDAIIDGENSHHVHDLPRAEALATKGSTTWTSVYRGACSDWSAASA